MCYLTVNCTAININESAIENCQMYDARKLYLTDSGGIEMPIKSDISPGEKKVKMYPMGPTRVLIFP